MNPKKYVVERSAPGPAATAWRPLPALPLLTDAGTAFELMKAAAATAPDAYGPFGAAAGSGGVLVSTPTNPLEPTAEQVAACRRILDEECRTRFDSYVFAVGWVGGVLRNAGETAADLHREVRSARAMLAAQLAWKPPTGEGGDSDV